MTAHTFLIMVHWFMILTSEYNYIVYHASNVHNVCVCVSWIIHRNCFRNVYVKGYQFTYLSIFSLDLLYSLLDIYIFLFWERHFPRNCFHSFRLQEIYMFIMIRRVCISKLSIQETKRTHCIHHYYVLKTKTGNDTTDKS